MSREIKFRAWCDTDKGPAMVYFYPMKLDNGLWFESLETHIDEHLSDPMQYTAYQDKVKKELYEGDVCKDRFNRIMQVQFHNGRLQFRCDDPENNFKWADMFQWLDNGKGMARNEVILKVEIIGNIHQNPELLKGGNSENNMC